MSRDVPDRWWSAQLGVALAATALLTMLAWTPSADGASTQILYQDGPVAIPDGHGKAVMSLTLASAPAGELVFEPRPNFRVRHPRTRDLKLSLRGPNGITRVMSNRDTRGRHLGSGACEPTYNPTAPTGYTGFNALTGASLDDGSAPYTGYFSPAQAFGPLIGIEPEGTWKLKVKDTRDGKRGKLLCGLLVLNLKEP